MIFEPAEFTCLAAGCLGVPLTVSLSQCPSRECRSRHGTSECPEAILHPWCRHIEIFTLWCTSRAASFFRQGRGRERLLAERFGESKLSQLRLQFLRNAGHQETTQLACRPHQLDRSRIYTRNL